MTHPPEMSNVWWWRHILLIWGSSWIWKNKNPHACVEESVREYHFVPKFLCRCTVLSSSWRGLELAMCILIWHKISVTMSWWRQFWEPLMLFRLVKDAHKIYPHHNSSWWIHKGYVIFIFTNRRLRQPQERSDAVTDVKPITPHYV